MHVLDFAGGTVVHVNSGVAGLMCALMLGKRKDTGPAHNVVLTLIGASLLWVGWFGFNAGSAVSAGVRAGMAMTVTQIATAVAGSHLDVRRMGAPRQANCSSASAPVRSRASSPSRRLRASSARPVRLVIGIAVGVCLLLHGDRS